MMLLLLSTVPSYAQRLDPGDVGAANFFAIKRTDIAAASVNLSFGFTTRLVIIETPAANTDEICLDWSGGTAVCPAANSAGDDRIRAGTTVVLDRFVTSSISVIAASGTQTIYVRAFK